MQEPIITSLLDTDLYKFTMMQCVFHHFKDTQVRYRFKCRKLKDLRPYAKAIQAQIDAFCDLHFEGNELNYLASLPYIKPDFIDYLSRFHLNKEHIILQTDNQFDLVIQGPWLNTILFEVPLLAIISETYFKAVFPHIDLTVGRERLQEKIKLVQTLGSQFNFSDFGTRRRFSKQWQEELIVTLKENLPEQFIGTSNVYFAKKFNLKPIGTMAHEFLQACQVLSGHLKGSQQFALQIWLKEYQGALGIALTDVLNFDIFLEEFDAPLANVYDGLRQDSGDPLAWGDKAIAHYEKLGIDPKQKIFIFSDTLTFPKAAHIYNYFKGRVQCAFGIGTNLTHDVGLDPLDIVLKMTHTNNQPVIKISDSPGKIICEDEQYLQTVKDLFHLKG